MRILQVIDSLEIGGAERMAINYANGLADKIEFSGIVVTRKEGELKSKLNTNVSYLFLDKRKIVDFRALKKLKKYCKENKITHLHPHSTSYFFIFLFHFFLRDVKIIWHDHYGLSEFLSKRKSLVLKIASRFFQGIISVNYQLKEWAEKELYCKNVIYLPNFTSIETSEEKNTKLSGLEGKRILCLANLRIQKNHFFLIEIAKKIKETHPDWTFHLVGKDFNDSYSLTLREKIQFENLQNTVFIYGSKNDTSNIINQSEICIFTSSSEGLPVALLEFGLHSKAVVSTSVGEIPLIIKNDKNGLLVDVDDVEGFNSALNSLINNSELRNQIGMNLHDTILKNNSEEAVLNQYLSWLNSN
ncbi:glycosyltransferase [Flavobacterium capsici]|uniref:Glycosyltransferase n=1 Tax=Flavobacterium capsici TaxID=3075618 RepID=A0AA96EX68_9FLAO|nr:MULTISPECIES: glycosyltransferase [unclassified Flavobacterium]WNM20268.1 glycosyltransferase [Flavobacterium sp. PMR2A8]WNM21658.1 glycosyltransferase [Flavobacterium sp. PMTSA4]